MGFLDHHDLITKSLIMTDIFFSKKTLKNYVLNLQLYHLPIDVLFSLASAIDKMSASLVFRGL
jgi:hypothetical protein